ncbi:MAG TPA: hypothetical protein VHV51_00520 [Polyangiaceae bacterium]|jgi:hypothetical protein|nr:hypothetical protein [Polyangiaceae bacterium]
MTRFAWILNLDAELELAKIGFEYVPRQKLTAQLAEYGRASRALLGPEDVLLGEQPNHTEALLGRAWCPTPRAVAALEAAQIMPEPHPPAEVLRRVNHRLFAHELGGGLPEQRYFTERAPVEALLRRAERRWLVKRPLAFAGRGQMRFYGPITKQQWSWLDVSLERDGVIVEPLVRPELELSLHGFVWPRGRAELGRICVQEVTARGVFRALRLARPGELPESDLREFYAQGERVADALSVAGYFGPFGIDAYRYELDGQIAFCALGEINARYTMGFATGFPRPASELSLI